MCMDEQNRTYKGVEALSVPILKRISDNPSDNIIPEFQFCSKVVPKLFRQVKTKNSILNSFAYQHLKESDVNDVYQKLY
ncbi:unnamed protein product [Chironomus riparius]|uniref:Uncharacterized protein n=1 Tax=Chironomus riparius TaxID=315576 RepID=A0A9N9WQ80_9DIPT|nr:unnamed protein product [Chironomus riparius]